MYLRTVGVKINTKFKVFIFFSTSARPGLQIINVNYLKKREGHFADLVNKKFKVTPSNANRDKSFVNKMDVVK